MAGCNARALRSTTATGGPHPSRRPRLVRHAQLCRCERDCLLLESDTVARPRLLGDDACHVFAAAPTPARSRRAARIYRKTLPDGSAQANSAGRNTMIPIA